jgi:hypothetical protein
MTVFHRLGKQLRGEVLRALAGIKDADAQIYGIGAVLDRSTEGFH